VRLAVTGAAVANCLGSDNATAFERAFTGSDAFSPGSALCDLPFQTALGIASPLPHPAELGCAPTREATLAAASVRQLEPAVRAAVARWGAARIAYVFASSTGGLDNSERFLAPDARLPGLPTGYSYDDHWIDATTSAITSYLGIAGARMAVSTACSSSFKALASAHRLIEQGLADAAVVGSADSLCRTTIFGFHSLGLLSPSPTRPFSRERSGITLGEGSAYILVERAASSPLAWIEGTGAASDAHHHTSPHPEGLGPVLCMRQALDRASLAPDKIDYVSAHGTGTLQNDQVEAAAIRRVFERRIPITATKSLTGHTLGSAGLTALILAIESLHRQLVPPSLRVAPVDEALDVAMVDKPTAMPVHHILVNAFGFGGSNASVVVARP